MRSSFFPGLIAMVIPWLLVSCSSAEVSNTNPSSHGGTGGTGGNGGNGGGGGSIPLNAATSPEPDPTANMAAPPGCGDGVLAADEACDDGNTTSGDGCSANCLRVEPGYSCVPAGQLCHEIAHCGDGVAVPPEQCDDGNTIAGDGCSPTCKVEIGYKCSSSTTNAQAFAPTPPAATARSKARRAATTATPCPSMAARRIARTSPTAAAPRAHPGAATASCLARSVTTATTSMATAAPTTARSNGLHLHPADPRRHDDGSGDLSRLSAITTPRISRAGQSA